MQCNNLIELVDPLDTNNDPYSLDESTVKARASFSDLLQLIAQYSDVNAQAKDIFKSSRLVHLESENYTPPPDTLALTTTKSIPAFILAWWREFAQRDLNGPETRQIKWHSLHKARENRPSFRPYVPADNVVRSEALADPPLIYTWLPKPPTRLNFSEFDAKHFEGQTRKILNAASFIEAILQGLRRCGTDANAFASFLTALTPALKVVIQLQTATLCQWVQVRRDHWLAKASQVSPPDMQALRHAPLVGTQHLFPIETLERVNKQSEESVRYNAFLNLAKSGAPKKQPQQNDNRSRGTLVAPQFAREPFTVRHFAAVVSPVKRKQSSRVALDKSLANTKTLKVTASPVKHTPAYVDLDELPLANERQVSEWQDKYFAARANADATRYIPVGGRLREHADDWRAIGASRRVFRWLKKGFKLPFIEGGKAQALAMRRTTCPKELCIHYADQTKQRALFDLVDKLLEKGVIEEVPEGTLAMHCLIFLRPKPNGTWRGITDTSPLNEFLRVKPFKMDTALVIRRALTEGLWATSVDFSDAYYHIPMHPDHKQFLAFQVGSARYWFKATPFGLSPLPQVFTEIFTTLKVYARESLGVMIFQYIDDWMLLSRDRDKLADDTLAFANLCTDLGIIVNFDKSELAPSRRLIHLGIEWNFAQCTVRPPLDKVNKLRHTLALTINNKGALIATLESIRGIIASLEKVVPYGRINSRFFQALVTNHVQQGRHTRWIELSREALLDLVWWQQERNLLVGAPFSAPKPDVIITSDASTTGWGASYEGQTLAGRWFGEKRHKHINWLEMEAVRLTIAREAFNWRNKCIRFLIDNRTTVAYITKQGGTKSSEMTSLTRELLALTQKFDITLLANHLAGEKNAVADLLSRKGQVIKNEWRLDETTFNLIQRESPFGPATLDLFANALNHQLPRYGSPHHDDQAVLVDALTSPWPRVEVIYAFPPTTILDKVVTRIREEKPPRLLLVAPDKPAATWFPSLKRIHSRKVKLDKARLFQPHWQHEHHNPSSARLALWIIQGETY